MRKKDKRPTKIYPDGIVGKEHGTYQTQAISQADSRFVGSGAACPSDENVRRARNWVNENHK